MKQIKRTISKFLEPKLREDKNLKVIETYENFFHISQTQEHDVFITGYPKSGNTWMQNLISCLVYAIDGSFLPDTLTQELVPDIYMKPYYKRFQDRSFFKSHELPQPHMKNVIYLVRDGRDVMASYYAMNKSLGVKTSLQKMIIDGEHLYPSKWHIHVKSWLENPYDANIIIVKFENLVQDTSTEVKRILNFLNLRRSNDIIQRSIKGNSFQEMKRKENIYGWNNSKWDPTKKFIRRGEIGSYKNEVGNDLILKFENESFQELKFFDYIN